MRSGMKNRIRRCDMKRCMRRKGKVLRGRGKSNEKRGEKVKKLREDGKIGTGGLKMNYEIKRANRLGAR
jgi:hypothetical protein